MLIRRITAFTLVLLVLMQICYLASAQDTETLQVTFSDHLETMRNELIEVRRDIHRHPELSGQEERTASVVATRLEKLGFSVRTGVGGHGVVAVLDGTQPGPIVAFRADMDAVTSNAPDPVSFRSTIPGVRHICGHDIHTTIGLALAEGFAPLRDQLSGSIMLVFQPAEERATGARAMIADEIFGKTKPDVIFAYHTAPLPIGQVATATETLMAGRDRVVVTISGSGDRTNTAASIQSHIRSLNTVSAEEARSSLPPDFLFVQVGAPRQVHPDTLKIFATITTASKKTSAKARQQLEAHSKRFSDVDVAVAYEERAIAGVTNDPEIVRQATVSAGNVLGADAVVMLENVVPMFSEDFGSFQELVPGMMFFLGVSNPEKGWIGMPHTPNYVADEEAIFVGARVMAAIFLDYLAAH